MVAEIDQIVCENAVRNLVAAYARRADSLDAAGVADLFASDGTLTVGSGTHEGRDGIVKWLSAIAASSPPKGRHIVSNLLIDANAAAEGTATAQADMIFVARTGDGGPLHILAAGHYQDRFTNTPDGWRFAQRQIFFA